jgi:hypothetical protein
MDKIGECSKIMPEYLKILLVLEYGDLDTPKIKIEPLVYGMFLSDHVYSLFSFK